MEQLETFFASLSDEGRERAPVSLRLLPLPAPADPLEGRLAESAHHRAQGYQCYAFYKAISRCFATNR